ncbi:hypothetical protein HDU89_004997 [Geranomyces variabilis]|nr:hypothetical protein HDU89_004997 [Geranomyces variabilis]
MCEVTPRNNGPVAAVEEPVRQIKLAAPLFTMPSTRLRVEQLSLKQRNFTVSMPVTIKRPTGSALNFTFGAITFKKLAPNDAADTQWQVAIALSSFHDEQEIHKAVTRPMAEKRPLANKAVKTGWSAAKARRHRIRTQLDTKLWEFDPLRDNPRLQHVITRGHVRVRRSGHLFDPIPPETLRFAAVDPGGHPLLMVTDQDSADQYEIGPDIQAALRHLLSRISILQSKADELVNDHPAVCAA